MPDYCSHFDQVRPVEPGTQGCEECGKAGDTWVHLCLACGHVGCRDSSTNAHATRHFHASGHPVMRSHGPGESWGWCCVHEQVFDPMPRDAGGR